MRGGVPLDSIEAKPPFNLTFHLGCDVTSFGGLALDECQVCWLELRSHSESREFTADARLFEFGDKKHVADP